jgi:hypothetical protein
MEAVVTLLCVGAGVGALLATLLFPLPPRLGGAQAHLLCGSQVQTTLLLALAMPRLLLVRSFRCAAPATISERNFKSLHPLYHRMLCTETKLNTVTLVRERTTSTE